MSPKVSVVIPTHNRKDVLVMALGAYARQTAPDCALEIVVVDDGSTDGTREAVLDPAITSRLPIRYVRQSCRGQASARNRGIREALGEIVLFTDDDIIPCPSLVAEHAAWHVEHPKPSDGILGCVTWSPEVRATPFMEWLGEDGVLFGYGHIHGGQELHHGYFYSCNISLKKAFLLTNGLFDEDFVSYGCEDIELGRRLSRRGLCLFYNPAAVGYHYKKMSVADVWRRAELVEASRKLFRAKVVDPDAARRRSEVRAILRGAVRAALPMFAPVVRLFDTKVPLPWIVYRMFYFHYILPRVRERLSVADPCPTGESARC